MFPLEKQMPRVFILHPQLEKIIAVLTDCIRTTQGTGHPHGLIIDGVNGAGKSALLEYLERHHPSFDTDAGKVIPFVYAKVPAVATPLALGKEILARLGDPRPARGTPGTTSRVCNLLRNCDCQVLALDDFHFLIDRNTNSVRKAVTDWLATVILEPANTPRAQGQIGYCPLTVVVTSTDEQVLRVLQSNEQLKAIFTSQVAIEPFSVVTKAVDFKQFVDAYMKMRELEFAISEVSNVELYQRLHSATDGRVGYIAALVDRLRLLRPAGIGSIGQITLTVLHDAYMRELRVVRAQPSPFQIDL